MVVEYIRYGIDDARANSSARFLPSAAERATGLICSLPGAPAKAAVS
jgi:hypothetical protein